MRTEKFNLCKSTKKLLTLITLLLTLGVGQMWADCQVTNTDFAQFYNSVTNSSLSLTNADNNHYYGNLYVKGGTEYERKWVVGKNNSWSNWYKQDRDNNPSGNYEGTVCLNTGDGNDKFTTPGTTSDFKKLYIDLWCSYSWGSQVKFYYEDVSSLSPSLSASSTSISGGATSSLSASCTGGSGGYTYTYSCRNTTDGVDATSALSATSGTSVTFTGPVNGSAKTYRITVTAQDANSQLRDLGFSTQTAYKDITVAATVTPAITLTSVTPSSSIVAGNDITLEGTRANSSNTISFQYTTNDGDSWTDITPKSSSLSSNTLTAVWTVPDAHGATQTFKFRAKLAEASPIYSSKSDGVTVYNTKTIHVRNINDWANFYVYRYNSASDKEANWHGSTTGVSPLAGQWKDVVMTSQWEYFIINDNGSNQIEGDNTYTYTSSISNGGYYTIQESTGTSLTLTSTTAPEAPSATTNEATVNSATSLTFNYSVGANRDKTTPGVAYKQSDSNIADPATIYSSGTRFEAAAINGNASGTFSNKTITAGKDYYYVAYGINGFGTTYGDIRKIRTTGITLNKKGGDSGSGNFVAVGGKTISAITAPSKTGYTFAGYWTSENDESGTKYYNANGSAAVTNWPTNLSASLTLYAHWTPNKYDVTLKLNGGTGTDNQVVQATYDAEMPLVIKTTGTAIAIPTKTGYTLLGYWDATSGGNQYYAYSGSLSSSRTWNKTSATDLYARWQANAYTLTLKKHNGQDDVEATATYDATISVTPPTKTGYTFNGYYTASSGGTRIIAADGHFVTSVASWTNSSKQWIHTSAETLHAQWTAKTYDVILDVNGATTGSDQTVVATFDANMPTTQKTSGDAITAPSKTGYTFDGYWTSNTGTGTQYYTNLLASNHVWDVATNNTHIYAKWTANNYTVTLDVDEANQGTISGATTSQSVTYDGATTTVSNRPTAANGYALDGYYTDQLGEGTKVIDYDGTWIASIDGYTDADKKWVHDGDVTLYAYYKKAEITNIAFSPGTTVSPNATVTLTPTVSPTPTGTTVICWKLLRNNGNLLSDDFEANPSTPGNNVTFTAPETSSSYKVAAVLRTGSGCGTGTKLDSVVYDLVVAGSHTVTIRYQDSDGRTLAASTETEGRPLAWSSEINPATITGYTFDHWVAGDGVTITTDDGETTVTETSTETIKIQATYDGPLTAVYNKKRLIFFNNTLNWENVYVYFYSGGYWNASNGTGSETGGNYTGINGQMQPISEGSKIYYFDAEEAGVNASYTYVAFTELLQNNYEYFAKTKDTKNKVIYRTDYKSTQLPMYVPLAGVDPVSKNSGLADYYDKGYWMNYPENTGYWLKIYNQTTTDGATKLYDLPFTFPDDHAMPLELAVDLEAGQTYGFEIARADGNNYRNTGTMTANTTNWAMTDESQYCGLQTTAAGEYIFRLAYFAVSSNYQYRVGVTYPVAVNDYRIVYTDGATWSKGAHGASWYHPSGVITKNSSATEVKNDTVSFFWSYGSSPAIAYQTCSAVAAGSASWSAGTSISVSDFSSVLTEAGVYNFIFQQPAGGASISLVKVEPYSGNYYIRTDCAGSTKWVNYRALDHQMTYSDYAEANSGYSHYFCHWVTTGTNVKFVIANDYSACISDTLSEDYGVNKIANITAEGNNGAGTLKSGNASIRFMWNQKTNVINRAYISGSSNVSDRFLILEGDAKLYDENGNSYSISGLSANEVNLIDDQNFVYERTIKVNATAKAKLTAKYNNNVQYFKGGSGSTAEDSVQLLGGTYNVANKYSMRLVYDFKTDRLVTAYIPEGTVDAQLNIQADLMIIREHQEAGQQLLFSGSGALKEVQSVYGVMRFNRWTLNNRQHPEDHDKAHCWNDALITTYHPLLGPGNVKSIYERALYWISFPFDVNLSDVFGFGTYGTHWIIMKYNGAQRATDGYWKDSEGFWEYIWDRSNVTLEKGKGYVLALELELMQATDSVNFWTHQIQEVELFFPSASTEVGTITRTSVDVTVPPHECTIDRRTKAEKDAGTNNWDKDRTIADSHWNIIGVPSYANYGSTLTKDKEGTQTITWNSNPKTQSLPFLYEWNASDNTYTVQSGTTYNFKAMHAYYVQYTGNLHWTLASATPPSIVARRTYAEAPESIEMKIELQQNETMIDQTFVKLSNDENVSAGFAFGEDLNKEKNAGKANIYTFIDNYMPTAGNTMPMIDQTTFIPMGVSIPTAGEYTFAIPEGTDGVGVFLIDNVANTRTNLSALDYTVNLTTGTHDGRFVLEISPIHNATTDIEAINDEGIKISGARKVLIDGILYIVKGDKLYDVRGTMIK